MIEQDFWGISRHLEREKTAPQLTMVDKMMAEHFASPDLWQGKKRAVNKEIFGLGSFNRMGESEVIVDRRKTWLASLYGIRLVPVSGSEDEVTLEWTTLTTVGLIHKKLSETVLSGEDIRIATLVTPPFPEEGTNNPANNIFWVKQHAEGKKGPIMSKVNDPKDTPEDYEDHDYGSPHLGNNALFPQEAQSLFTTTSKYELAWRRRLERGEVSEKELLLPGEKVGDLSEFGFDFARGSYDGTKRMDYFSAGFSYMDLLSFVVAGSSVSPQRRLALVKDYEEYTHGVLSGAGGGYADAYVNTLGLVDFNTRHREGRNATWEEVDQEFDKFMTGVVRVATKIRGEFSF